jgi:thioredoxin 1
MIDIKNPSDLNDKILSADVALVDFWAPWCAPCKALAPNLEVLQAKNPSLVIGKVNVDENPELAKAAGIRGLPTVVLFKKGESVGARVGLLSVDKLQQFIDGTAG